LKKAISNCCEKVSDKIACDKLSTWALRLWGLFGVSPKGGILEQYQQGQMIGTSNNVKLFLLGCSAK